MRLITAGKLLGRWISNTWILVDTRRFTYKFARRHNDVMPWERFLHHCPFLRDSPHNGPVWSKYFSFHDLDILAVTKQPYEWFILSVCPSVCPSHLFHYVPNDRSDVHAKGQGQRSKVKVTVVKTQFNGFLAVTPVSITYDDEMMHKAWCCFGEVPYCISRSSVKFQGYTSKKSSSVTQIGRFRSVIPVWIHWWLRIDVHSLKQPRRCTLFFSRSSVKFQGHTGQTIIDFDPNWAFPD